MNQLLFVVLLFLSEPAVSKAFKYEHANPNFCDINGLNPCKSKVSINCVITDGGGYLPDGSDCLNDDSQGEEKPFYYAQGPKCDERIVKARIEFKLCNRNEDLFIALNPDQSYITFRDLKLDFDKSDIAPNTCRTLKVEKSWDLCDVSENKGRKRRPFDVQLDGRVPTIPEGNDNHCYCYTYRRSTNFFIKTEPIIPPTSSPTPPPTDSPTVPPTLSPTHVPTDSPTAHPTLSPTPIPTKSPTASPTTSPSKTPTLMPSEISDRNIAPFPLYYPSPTLPIESPSPTNGQGKGGKGKQGKGKGKGKNNSENGADWEQRKGRRIRKRNR